MSGLERVVMELADESQPEAIELAKSLGFETVATLPRYVRDLHSRYHDLLILGKGLSGS